MKRFVFVLSVAAVAMTAATAVAQEQKTVNPAQERTDADNQRGPAGFSPQESSPANGGINLPSTTGQGSGAGAARLSPETREQVVAIFHKHKVDNVRLDTPVQAGARIPADVQAHVMPKDVADIVPQWRGHQYLMAGDETLIVDPASHTIVAILVNQ